ncbi:phosphatase PAP2 family protein [Isoptericola croceus]|uniref:phosphatase PAP2 family protein n=1 Tax=Isoptericola croceus TaxID=3031406 RepID=UPI0023F7EC8D|nr:phosphatase PAP2 family protein [Isoptericola croceus]
MRAVVLAASFGLLFVSAILSPWGQRTDELLFNILATGSEAVNAAAGILRSGLLLALGAVALVLGVMALRRSQIWAAVALATMCAVSGALSVLLRDTLLVRPTYDHAAAYLVNTFPSTHATLTCSFAVTILVLWPYRSLQERVVVRSGVVLTVILACLANVVSYSHRPADVLGSVLLVGFVASLAGTVAPRSMAPSTGSFHPVD